MSAARVCIGCLFANVRRQRVPCPPKASSSKPRISRQQSRAYATHSSTGASAPSPERATEAPDQVADQEKQPELLTSDASTSSKTTRLHTDSPRTLALAKWSALRQSALLALERQQRDLRQRLGEASARINDISGYKEIEALKAEVTRKELELLEARTAAREAKEAYSAALSDRMASSREVNDLLQRKNNWLESDVSRFTELVRQDHLNEHRERDSKIEVTREEETVERKIGEMMQAILRRYHEEQVWSDKIRSLSTYGTLAITCINVVIFMLALTLVEPWKRRRMVTEVEERMRERDEQQSAWLSSQLGDIKRLVETDAPRVSSAGAFASIPFSANIESKNGLADNQNRPTESARLGEIIPATASESTEDIDRTSTTAEGTSEQQSRDRVPRDAYYSGATGALLGAAAITCWNALFR